VVRRGAPLNRGRLPLRPVPSVLDKRLVLVTGKGGVGKTTVAASLGLLAARRGKRTIVCEVAEQERISSAFGVEGVGYSESELAPGLNAISIDPERAKQEWLQYQLRSGTLAGILGQSRIFQYLTAAAPGLSELVTIGKIWELAQLQRKTQKASSYDLVLVDAPATGHGLAMLGAPRTYAEIARVGPIRRQALMIDDFLSDAKSTGVVAVAQAEEMAVTETLDLQQRLREEMGQRLDTIVANGVYPERFSTAEAEQIQSLDGRGSPQARAALRAALFEHRWARGQRAELRRLRRGADAPVLTLPYLFEEELSLDDLEVLSRELERKA
jgi:anion-transporting  ArsA/GET3 family ATPase